jgi:hypothetical protein
MEWTNSLKDTNYDSLVKKRCEAWWCMPVIPALGRLRQKDTKFKASRAILWVKARLSYIVNPFLKKKKKKLNQELGI